MRWRDQVIRYILAGAVVSLCSVSPASALQVGQKAPDFTLLAPGGKQVRLADLTAKGPLVIYTFVEAAGAV